jgi:thymidylate synthase
MNIEQQYLNLLKEILETGNSKEDRTGTGTLSLFGRQIRHKMSDGFPLVTSKKMHFKGIVTELLWFLRSDTNIKFLLDNNCHIWDGDCYRAFEKYFDSSEDIIIPSDDCLTEEGELISQEEFIQKIKTDSAFAEKWGNLGKIYGHQWRKWENLVFSHKTSSGDIYVNQPIDQIAELIKNLKENPDSRRLKVTAWNPSDLPHQTLPPCHTGFQCYTRELSLEERIELAFKSIERTLGNSAALLWELYCQKKTEAEILEALNTSPRNIPKRAISLMYEARSQDFPLGTPFNISSYALLLTMIAKQVNMVPEELIANMGDCHIYKNQIEGVIEQLSREPLVFPTLKLSDKVVSDISEYTHEDIALEDYKSHPKIFFPLSN